MLKRKRALHRRQIRYSQESRGLQAELEHEKDRLKLFLDMMNTLVSNLELRDFLRAISASIRKVVHCDVVGAWLPDSVSRRSAGSEGSVGSTQNMDTSPTKSLDETSLVARIDIPSHYHGAKGARSISSLKRTSLGLVVGLAMIPIALLLGCNSERKQGSTAKETAPIGTDGHAAGEAPPIPQAGPLAEPRSIRQVGLPMELTRTVLPPDNPQTPAKIALGQRLFFEGRLSADGSVACATCHDPARGFTDGRPTSIGIHGRAGRRNSPTILNALYNKTQFWDGRAKTLEEQAAFPIVNSVEMGQPSLDAAVAAITGIKEYKEAFRKVFGRPVNAPDLLRALGSYERTLMSFDSPFDHFIAGDKNAIDDAAKRGWELFNTQGRCNKCHALSENERDVTNCRIRPCAFRKTRASGGLEDESRWRRNRSGYRSAEDSCW